MQQEHRVNDLALNLSKDLQNGFFFFWPDKEEKNFLSKKRVCMNKEG